VEQCKTDRLGEYILPSTRQCTAPPPVDPRYVDMQASLPPTATACKGSVDLGYKRGQMQQIPNDAVTSPTETEAKVANGIIMMKLQARSSQSVVVGVRVLTGLDSEKLVRRLCTFKMLS